MWLRNILIIVLILLNIHFVKAQDCVLRFHGKLADKEVTICFYEYEIDSIVKGYYFYKDNKHNNIFFEGTVTKIEDGIYEQVFTEYNNHKQITGYFQGILEAGVMKGKWNSPNGEIIYKYHLEKEK